MEGERTEAACRRQWLRSSERSFDIKTASVERHESGKSFFCVAEVGPAHRHNREKWTPSRYRGSSLRLAKEGASCWQPSRTLDLFVEYLTGGLVFVTRGAN